MNQYRAKMESLSVYNSAAGKPSLEAIREIEQELGGQLPSDYIDLPG